MIHGIINIYKEKGYTSHDVVAKLRGILKQKKIGHTGTLDPEAEGVLPVCLGVGTKLCDMLTDKEKTYRAVLLLGKTTDTQDTTGTVLVSRSVSCTEEEVREAAESFRGEYHQIPPMYSALKVNGKKLYELAREGKTVERKARQVQNREVCIEKIDLPRVTMTVTCSKGTYIRTLCHDIGEKLGCGGCMEQLTRLRVGGFGIKDSLTLEQVRTYRESERLREIVIPVDQVFDRYPAICTKPEFDKMLYNGNPLYQGQVKNISSTPDPFQMEIRDAGQTGKGWIRVYDSGGQFCGVYVYRQDKERYQPEKMFLIS